MRQFCWYLMIYYLELCVYILWIILAAVNRVAKASLHEFYRILYRTQQSIAASLTSTSASVNRTRRHSGPTLTQLSPTSAYVVLKLLRSSELNTSPVDVLLWSLLRLSRAGHRSHDKPVVRRVPISSGFQDSAVPAAACTRKISPAADRSHTCRSWRKSWSGWC